MPHNRVQQFTENYSVRLQAGAVTAGRQLQDIINSRLTPTAIGASATTALTFLNGLNTFFLNVLIVLILAFYMMLDGHKLVREALAYFPAAADDVMESVHQIINRKFGGYMRSQVILALSYGLLTYIISVGFALRYSVLISIVAAVAMLVPFIGAFVAVAPRSSPSSSCMWPTPRSLWQGSCYSSYSWAPRNTSSSICWPRAS